MSQIPVLIIDDDEADRYLLKRLLKETKLELCVHENMDGRQAIDFLNHSESYQTKPSDEFPPVLIFLDINMPIMNGWEFLDEFLKLREDKEQIQSTVVVMFTSSDQEHEVSKALNYNFVKDYIVKGEIEVEDLKERIEQNIKV